MPLVDKLKQVKPRDFVVPVAGIVAMGAHMYGGVLAGEFASRHFSNPELIGSFQLAGNFIGGGIIFFPVYTMDCYFRYRDEKGSRFFKDQAKLGTVFVLGTFLNSLKPVVSGQLMRRGLSQEESTIYYDLCANTIRIFADNFAYLNNVVNLRLRKKQ